MQCSEDLEGQPGQPQLGTRIVGQDLCRHQSRDRGHVEFVVSPRALGVDQRVELRGTHPVHHAGR
ncbi:hypothetical protein ACFFX0_03140 [Citricoccus parietis]|uniref:Uncharacterized protein n=1 Tax=Citricoccus parietis TaxID=592307 RepID=A0ABV5FU71_9MICC